MQEILPPERPFRPRRDGWTAERREAFLDALAKIGTVAGACRAVGRSTTNAYRTKERIPEFSARWDAIQAAHTGAAIEEAMRRAVEGWDEPIFHAGKQVGVRRRYSDGLLKTVINRSDRAAEAETAERRALTGPKPAAAPTERAAEGGIRKVGRSSYVKEIPIEEVEQEILRRLAALHRQQLAEQAEMADRMRAAGLCP